ncbi:hypothetical protein [Baaleninema simplex]|uniref:hypothetical protein n=1 Tax=Baaleninema simplex TaxID=2862350 RepID=UPI00037606D6|nr:hypothetical protein [Baaleninema simplex]
MMQRTQFNTPAIDVFLKMMSHVNRSLQRDIPPIADLNQLRSLPPDTFGRAWADLIDDRGLEPFTAGPRRLQLHDGLHVLTGYDTDPLGEAEVQAFLLGAKFHGLHVIILTGLLRTIQRQRRFYGFGLNREAVRSRLYAAYQRGRQANFDPDTWEPEQLWHRSLHEVRSKFGLG